MQLRDLSGKRWISFAGVFLHACVHWFQQQVAMTDVHTSTETYWFAVAKQPQGGIIRKESWIKFWPFYVFKIK